MPGIELRDANEVAEVRLPRSELPEEKMEGERRGETGDGTGNCTGDSISVFCLTALKSRACCRSDCWFCLSISVKLRFNVAPAAAPPPSDRPWRGWWTGDPIPWPYDPQRGSRHGCPESMFN